MKHFALVAVALALFSPSGFAAPSAKPAGKADRLADARKAIDELNQKEIAGCMKMDPPASAALWADDGVDLIQGLKPMIGKETISKWYDSLTPQLRGAKMEYCTIEWQEMKIQGDWAWEWGINRQKIDFPPPQKPFESVGKILFILKRQTDKSWKIELESWNSNPEPQNEN
ncbi:MAG TPA: hypothetical protein VJN21_03390 [Candidatus Acidoferrales bacterium]|nr:hypothetical protein [Candidatus Acidoferrales bacterium]